MANVKKTTTLMGVLLLTGCSTGLIMSSAVVYPTAAEYTLEQNEIGEFVFCLHQDCREYERKELAQTSSYLPPIEIAEKKSINIFFNLGSSRLSNGAMNTLREMLPKLRNMEVIHLRGWADSIGGRNTAINRRLSRERANAIKKWLIRHGVKGKILIDSKPACCNQNDTRTVVITWQ